MTFGGRSGRSDAMIWVFRSVSFGVVGGVAVTLLALAVVTA